MDHDHDHHGHSDHGSEALNGTESAGNACSLVELQGEYDLALHIGAIFIIMAVSFLGTTLPMLFQRFFSIKSLVFQSAKLFGAGVILSVAWIHMLHEAAEALHSSCIPAAISKYHGYSGFMSLLGMLLTHLVQVLAMRAMSKLLVHKHVPEGDSEKTVDSMDKEKDDRPVDHHHDHSHGGLLVHSHKKASIYLLEGGITSHSIIIGVALGVAREDFTLLLTAIAFHQFFEGIALSAIVLEAEFTKKLIAWVMVLFYTLSTPIGIAIGVGVAQVYNENAGDTLMAIASLDSLSAGILIYDVVANILSPHFNRQSFLDLKGWHQGTQLLFLWLGAAAMAIIGIWA